MKFLIVLQLFSVFCWFFSLPLVAALQLPCGSISGCFWHWTWQGKVLQYSGPPRGRDILHSVPSIKLLYPLWISGKVLCISYLGVTPPPVRYKRARGGRSWAHLLCWEPERRCSRRRVLPGGALAPVRQSASVSPRWNCPTVSASWDPCVQSPPVSEARRGRGGLVREWKGRAGPWWGN